MAIIAFVAFGAFVGNEAVQSWAGQFPPPIPAVDLTFPLRGGDYLIVNGGSDIRINAHVKTRDICGGASDAQPTAIYSTIRGNAHECCCIAILFF